MSMGRFLTICIAALGLSACQMALPSGTSGVTQVALSGGEIQVSAPSGYCIDQTSLRDQFVLMGNCSSLSGQHAPGLKGKTAVIALSLTDPLDETAAFEAETMSRLFATQTGRAALSRTGRAETVTVLGTEVRKDVVLVHAQDSSPAVRGGLAETYWRAVFLLDGRLATVTVTPFEESPMSDSAVKNLLIRLVADLQAKNRDVAT